MAIIDNLDFESIKKLVDGSAVNASYLIETFGRELEDLKVELEELNKKIDANNRRQFTLFRAAKNVAIHLKKELPLVVQRSGYILVLSDKDLTIERNVI